MRMFLNKTKILCTVSFLLGSLFNLFLNFLFDKSLSLNNSNIHPKLSKNVFLVIFIFSSINNFKRREAIRETWTSNIESLDVRYYFVISSHSMTESQEMLLQEEGEKFDDLLLLSNIEDTFLTLTNKILNTIKWISDKEINPQISPTIKTFKSFNFLLKCDDDSYVRVDKVVDELRANYQDGKGRGLYWGFFDGRARVNSKGKYQENKWNICDHYLPYALGGGYILSSDLVLYLGRNAEYLKLYNNEDVSIGAWLSSYSGINRVHDTRFDTEYISRGCNNQYLITHKHSINDFRNFHKNIKVNDKLCMKEFKTRLSYVYNWNVLPSQCCVRNNANIP